LWGVADHSVVLPDGAVPLLIGSRAWYTAVGSSRYLCQNIDFDRFFRHRPHQRYLQTFHGYPFKSMGISLWRAQGKVESVIDAECERRNSAWDALLVPSEPCVSMYRREYRYEGEILVTGYPRNDSLVGADAEIVRRAVRQRLGIAPDKTVVLYAPTWRDTVATGAWTARLFDELDLEQLTEQLGEGYAVLLRGHNYNLRDGGTSKAAAVLDVSSYPEINDLILAADVAILDYSSLRFDWLITEKPVLFFVPDLDDYLSARTVLFDYRSSAPGPLLKSTDEVIAALHDLPAVSRDFADARRTFNATFNGLHDGNAAKRVVNAFFD
jgi:CDP-glycerol glycerophosphotransferase